MPLLFNSFFFFFFPIPHLHRITFSQPKQQIYTYTHTHHTFIEHRCASTHSAHIPLSKLTQIFSTKYPTPQHCIQRCTQNTPLHTENYICECINNITTSKDIATDREQNKFNSQRTEQHDNDDSLSLTSTSKLTVFLSVYMCICTRVYTQHTHTYRHTYIHTQIYMFIYCQTLYNWAAYRLPVCLLTHCSQYCCCCVIAIAHRKYFSIDLNRWYM